MFQDMRVGKAPAARAGWTKIVSCCHRAASFGINWVWVDTCCINKSSSAELSEAINSMFQRYQGAEVCYAYLSDVSRDTGDDINYQMSQSRWFMRGWTLQELLAPQHLTFLDKEWRVIGTKSELSSVITKITGIATTALKNIDVASVAMKMSWASRRTTSRIEDMAYCLMGLFDINMPLLYGEGQKAFQRLQVEIVRNFDDDSIFAWGLSEDGTQLDLATGYPHLRTPWEGSLIAPSPRHFSGCGDVQNMVYYKRPPYAITNRGLRIEAHLLKFPGLNFVNSALIPLNSARITKRGPVLLAIKVSKVGGTALYLRDHCAELELDAKVRSSNEIFGKVPVDATAAEFFDILAKQPLQIIDIPLQHSARIRVPETLSSEPVDWTEISMKARMKRLGIEDHDEESQPPQAAPPVEEDGDT